MQPHLTRKLGGVLQSGSQAADWPSLNLSDRSLHVVREGMWAVVNEPGGTAPSAKLSDQRWQMAGKTGSSQVRRVSREQREGGHFDSSKLPWEFRPHALFVAYAPYDDPRYALSVVVEHGNAGAAAAAPIARDIMTAALQRDPAGRDDAAWCAGRRARGVAMREGRIWRDTSFGIGAKIWQVNWLYVVLLCALAGVGYAALYSAAGGAAEPYASRHVLGFATGLVLMIGIALVDIRFIARLAWPGYCVALVLLVLVMRYGVVGKGAQRWIELGGLQIQPSELMKIMLVLALASWFHRASWERIGNPLFLIPPLVAVLVPVGLIVKEPNLGTAVITAALGAAMFFAAGVRWWKFLFVALPVPFAAQIVYGHLHDYQRARIDTFLQPESDPLGAGYNIIQSKIALGSGGMWGRGSCRARRGISISCRRGRPTSYSP